MILTQFPTAEEFYTTYWSKKPFVVRGAIPPSAFDAFIDPDTLAALSLEDDVKSRLVKVNHDDHIWACQHGPLKDEDFTDLGHKNWNLLVQNVEQYHTETAELLKHFPFTPQWMLDDIMVSCSAAGGSVGPHTDSYHVFLVQGMGKRCWTIGTQAMEPAQQKYVQHGDLKILKDGFEGTAIDVEIGDIIYVPPHFGHEGITQETALTFSVGFLEPKISDLLSEFANFIEHTPANARYSGDELAHPQTPFALSKTTQNAVRDHLKACLDSDEFSAWLARYFSTPTHDETDNIETENDDITSDELATALEDGAALHHPEYIKLAITEDAAGHFNIGIYGHIITANKTLAHLINRVSQGNPIRSEHLTNDPALKTQELELLTALYSLDALSF